MAHLKRYIICFLVLALVFVGTFTAEAANSMASYIASPPFISAGGVEPNLLLLIDNSASMHDLAYVGNQGYCYDDTYDSASTYVGYFEPGSWYAYNLVAEKFELKKAAEAATICGSATYTNTDACITSNATSVTTFAAKGNFLNWVAASKLDVEKEILTGGKYDSTNSQLIMESRGCLDKRFVKKVALTDSGSNTYYLTLAARPPENKEKAHATDDTTRIEIFEVTDTGFNNSACQSAIEELSDPSPNQGQIKQDIEDCMSYTNKNKAVADAMNAFNHSLYNCWYESKQGIWPPGAGPIESINNDCETIYQDGIDPSTITPEHRAYVCNGSYDGDPTPDDGYVGRCWNDTTSTWESDACIEAALYDYCQYLEIPEVVDPSDQADVTGEFWNIPAVLIDSGVIAQMGEPLVILKAYVAQSTAPTGLLQEYAADLRIGAMVFNDDGSKSECTQPDPHILYDCADAANRDGGRIITYIDQGITHTTNLVSALNGIKATSWTPVAEAMYNAIGYYTQNSFLQLDVNDFFIGTDPVTEWCQANNILIVTDGASTADLNTAVSTFVNTAGQNDGGSDDLPDCGSLSGSTSLDDLTYFAKQGTDIYPIGQGQLNGMDKQNITTYIVVAGALRSTGADECSPDVLLTSAAQNGGTSLYQATDPSAMETRLREAFTAILGSASGTVVSILSTSGEGEGAVYQAHFKPNHSTNTEEVYWTGYMQSLWVDAHGNLREDWTAAGDTTPNRVLDLGVDPIVTFFYDSGTGETQFKRRLVSLTDFYGTTATPTIHPLSDLKPLWEAGSILASRSAADRTIYTFVDLDGDGLVDGNLSVNSDEFISFNNNIIIPDDNKDKLTAYLDLADDFSFAYLGPTGPDRANNLITYIRGSDSGFTGTTDLRNRTLNSQVFKLGDIVHSTPTPIGRPVDNFDLIYGDNTYAEFYLRHKNRATVVYVGANDGMLHAFLAGTFHPGASVTGDAASFTVDAGKYGSLGPGDEIWAYIPQNLLPHLKWLADPGYIETSHVYYVDLKPRIFDTRIYDHEGADWNNNPLKPLWDSMSQDQRDDRPHGWSTILVGGMRLGGGSIPVAGDFNNDGDASDLDRTFASAFFALDITDPLKPILLWERNYPGLGFTTSFPAVLKVEKRSIDTTTNPDTINTLERHWYLLFGSGPSLNHYDGTSAQRGSLFLVDMATGRTDVTTNPGRVFTQLTDLNGKDNGTLLPPAGFMGSPVSVDLSVDYSVNVSYIGESHASGTALSGFEGGLYRLQVPATLDSADGEPVLLYDVDPKLWVLSHMFRDKDYAITAAPGAAVGTADSGYSLWVYFGTGRYLSVLDEKDASQNRIYGVKDPYYNSKLDPGELSAQLALEPFTEPLLYDATPVKVYTDGTIAGGPAGVATFNELKGRQEYNSTYELGWFKILEAGERIITKPSILGGILLAPSFIPNDDICGFGGNGFLHALYFETGTAYNKSVVGTKPEGVKDKVLDRIDLGVGISSSLGIHVGREHGARGFIQQSTGTINQIDLKPAFSVKSGFVNWREVR
jgi:type IV pilus assembly protein PilY1